MKVIANGKNRERALRIAVEITALVLLMAGGAGALTVNANGSADYTMKYHSNDASITTNKIFKVLVINFDPIIESQGNKRLHEVLGWNDPHQLAQGYINDLNESSGNFAQYQIVEWIDADVYPIKEDGFQYTDATYLDAWYFGGPWHSPDLANYSRIITDYNITARVASGEIDEVFMFGGPYFGFYESRMVGLGAYWVNSPGMPDVQSDRLFILMGFSYERGVGEMLEDYGHRTESIMWHVYGSWYGWDSFTFEREVGKILKSYGTESIIAHVYERAYGFYPSNYTPKHNWDKFTLFDKIAQGNASCGNVHYAPNSYTDYDWGNSTYVWSTCDDWLYNWPNLNGTKKLVNASEWGGGDSRLYFKWWFRHIPNKPGINPDGKQNNWWKYMADFNNYSESGGTPAPHTITVNASGGADYTRIQDAIDNASAGDTILVYSGTYYENVNVSKQLILQGIDKGGGKPVVDGGGNGNVITLSADGITLDRFDARNGSMLWPNAGINVTASNNIIKNNSASNNLIGISLYYSNNNIVSGNNASNNSDGISLYYSSNNIVSGNNASNNGDGLVLGSSSNNNLSGNNASNNSNSIDMYSSSNNTLSGNNASNNNFGIFLISSDNNNMSGNNANSNNLIGIFLDSANNNNTLASNTVGSNSYTGIYLYYSSSNSIYNNYFNNTNNFAIVSSSNLWNTTKIPGINIIGGPYLGGNFWANPSGTGFSQTCADNDSDGICDSPYMLDINNIDYLSLAYSPIIGGSVISISSQTVAPGSVVTIPIMANNITNVAAYTISLTYNPSVVAVDSVGAGALGTPFTTINNVIGVTQMSAFTATPQSGNVMLANVTLRSVGTAGQASPLNLTITALSDNNGTAIPATVSSGIFSIATSTLVINASRANLTAAVVPTNNITTGLNTSIVFTVTDGTSPVGGATVAVTQGPSVLGANTTNPVGQATIMVKAATNSTVYATASMPGFTNGTEVFTAKGDVNGDGRVDIIDALFIAQYTVGTRTINTTVGDVSGDGNANIVDALFIAQYTVGLRPDPTTP